MNGSEVAYLHRDVVIYIINVGGLPLVPSSYHLIHKSHRCSLHETIVPLNYSNRALAVEQLPGTGSALLQKTRGQQSSSAVSKPPPQMKPSLVRTQLADGSRTDAS